MRLIPGPSGQAVLFNLNSVFPLSTSSLEMQFSLCDHPYYLCSIWPKRPSSRPLVALSTHLRNQKLQVKDVGQAGNVTEERGLSVKK